MSVETLSHEPGSGLQQDSPLPYSAGQVSVAAFIGGPLAAGWLMSRAFRAFGNPDGASRVVYVSIAAVVAIIVGVFLWPDVPNLLFPAATMGGYLAAYNAYLGTSLEEHLDEGRGLASWWGAIGKSIVSLLVTVLAIFAVVMAFPTLLGPNVQSGASIVYYDGAAEREDAQELIELLEYAGFVDEQYGVQLFLNITEDDPPEMQLEMSFAESIEMTETHTLLIEMRDLVANRFRTYNVVIVVQDQWGRTQFVIRGD